MLIVSFIYSITSSLGKLAILHSSPIFFGAVYFIILALAFAPIVMFKSRNNLGQIIKNYKFFGLLGFLPLYNDYNPYDCNEPYTGYIYDCCKEDKPSI